MDIGAIFNSGLTYPQYRRLVDKLVLEGKTTGNEQTEEKIGFTKLNVQRMNRLDKTIHLSEHIIDHLQLLNKPVLWLLIADAWCGDGAQIVPIINKIAEASGDKITLRIISRDSYPELMEAYLSNGSKAIPKLLVIEPESMEVICNWGPRPKPAEEIALRWKESKGKISREDFEKELHLWYSRDKGETISNELMNLMEKCLSFRTKGEIYQ